jgi:hypothetical protein
MRWRSLYWSSSSAAIWYPLSCGEGGFVRLRSPAPKPIFGAVSNATHTPKAKPLDAGVSGLPMVNVLACVSVSA